MSTGDADRADEVVHDTERSRYELLVDGEPGAFAEYVLRGNTITFTHTVTEPARRGQGHAAIVVRRALDDARAANLSVVAQCWYVAQFIDLHPEYADLVR
ncbi:MAG TPA: GNAT family N-acetyltransferase [Ilumatobacteraceae bacterium]